MTINQRIILSFISFFIFFSTVASAQDINDMAGLYLKNDNEILLANPVAPLPPGKLGAMARTKLELLDYEENQENQEYQNSRIEQLYAKRIIEPLIQYGYNYFRSDKKEYIFDESKKTPIAGVQDSYVLNIGDKVDIIIRGQKNSRKTYLIDSQGYLVIDDLSPFMAAGRTLGDIKADIRSAVRTMLHNTSVFVSMSAIGQHAILVIGHVKEPGQKIVSAFDSVIDVLIKSGGIEKTGSLRQIRVVRGNISRSIDLYDILMQSRPSIDISLRSGDRIIVPPIGPTVAVAGAVNRPAIYELLPSQAKKYHLNSNSAQKISPLKLLNWAGGIIDSGVNRFILIDPASDGQDHVQEVISPFKTIIGTGSILMAMGGNKKKIGQITLAGHTRRAGIYSLNQTHSLSSLIHSSSVVGADIYPLIGVISRFDESSLAREYIVFSPRDVIDGIEDRYLVDDDIVHLFSMKDIQNLWLQNPDFDKGSSLLDPLLVTFLNEHMVRVRGEVRRAGAYPVAGTTSLDVLLKVAGGTKQQADIKKVEILYTREEQGSNSSAKRAVHNLNREDAQTIPISVGDAVRIGTIFKGLDDKSFVYLRGEVKKQGKYPLIRGEKLSSLIARAGGLTEEAYPEGTIFSRASERKREQERFRVASRDLEQSLVVAMQDEENKLDTAEVTIVRQLANELRSVKAVGRITVEADPDILAMHPEQDILLENNDHIYIPKRPLTVRVSGEILSPSSLQFHTDKNARDYISEAGGYNYYADKGRVFVLYPNGSAQPLHVNSWSHKPVMIIPGSTIIVPRDPKPFNFMDSARDFTQILTNLAITGIFLDEIADD